MPLKFRARSILRRVPRSASHCARQTQLPALRPPTPPPRTGDLLESNAAALAPRGGAIARVPRGLPPRLHRGGPVDVAFVEVDLGLGGGERRRVAVTLAVVAAELEQ